MQKYTCQCSRCDATGKYDRGTCFSCKGTGFVNSATTKGLTPFILTVVFENGKENKPRVFATNRDKAVMIVERQLLINNWKGSVC